MPTEVILPRVDMDMESGKVSRWYVAEGGHVAKGEPLFEIETDKAAMEVEAPATGLLKGIAVEEGVAIPVGTVIAWIYADGEAVDAAPLPPQPVDVPTKADGLAEPALATDAADKAGTPPTVESPAEAGVRATPLARRLARERGLDIATLRGSGPHGRVQAADLATRDLPPGGIEPQRRTRSVTLAGLNATWLREGEGLPLVMLHGYGADLNAWRQLLAVADLGRPVLGLDLPAHGLSDLVAVASFDDLCARVAEALDAAALGDLHLAGHSLGAAVAARLAGSGTVPARSLMLIAPAGLGPEINGAFIAGLARARTEASLRPWLRELVADEASLGPSFLRETVKQRADGRAGELQATLAAAVFPDGTQAFSIRSDLAHLAIPAKIVFGERDRIIPSRQARGLPGTVALHLFPDVGHMPHVEAKPEMARLLKELMLSAG